MWAEHGDPDIGPGSKVTIPVIDFPPQAKNLGSRMSANPEKALAQMLDEHGEDEVAEAIAAIPSLVTAAVQKAAEKVGRATTSKAGAG